MNPWFKRLRESVDHRAAVERMHARGGRTLPIDGRIHFIHGFMNVTGERMHFIHGFDILSRCRVHA